MAMIDDLVKDDELVASILHACESGTCIPSELRDKIGLDDIKQFIKFVKSQGEERVRIDFSKEKFDQFEALILDTGRPAIIVQNNTFQANDTDVWKSQIEGSRSLLEKIIPAVGAIKLTNQNEGVIGDAGTAWLVAPDVVVTNAHVAVLFAIKQFDGTIEFLKNDTTGQRISVDIDFRAEYQVGQAARFKVLQVLDINEKLDVAFLKISTNDSIGDVLTVVPITLDLERVATIGTKVATIGYPSYDPRAGSLEEVSKFFDGIFNVKRLQPGQVTRPIGDARQDIIGHDCSTLGGNSGSVVVDVATGKAVGLHYGGIARQANWAVQSQVLRKLMLDLGL
jgi:endonuclease G, mitochondrial